MSKDLVAQKRKNKNLTQEDMANRLNISRQHYNAIENFKKPPSVELAKNVAEDLGLEWTIFFTDKVNI